MKIVLLGCTSRKKSYKCFAKEMYSESDFFRNAYEYAKISSSKIYILSAKYGLLHEDDVIEPYNQTLSNQKKSTKTEWSYKACKQFETEFRGIKKLDIVCLAGQNYRKYLIPLLKDKFQLNIECPLAHMRFGKQKQFLKNFLAK